MCPERSWEQFDFFRVLYLAYKADRYQKNGHANSSYAQVDLECLFTLNANLIIKQRSEIM